MSIEMSSGRVLKIQDDQEYTYVLSAALVPERTDSHGDIISAEEIEKSAHGYMENSQRAGVMHKKMVPRKGAALVESYILRQETVIARKRLPVGTWMVAFRVYDEELRKKVLSGEFKGVSIGGTGKIEELE